MNVFFTVPTEIIFLKFPLLFFVFSVLLLVAPTIFRPKLLKVGVVWSYYYRIYENNFVYLFSIFTIMKFSYTEQVIKRI